MNSPLHSPPIRDASSLILLRGSGADTSVLMGQRGKTAAFMPGKFVFPGGAIDPEDFLVSPKGALSPICESRLRKEVRDQEKEAGMPNAAAIAAQRELLEETGLRVSSVSPLSFVFRAITPPNRPRRFDARFFVATADAVENDLDDFSRAEDELSYLQWVPLVKTQDFALPFVTKIVLGEVMQMMDKPLPPAHVPFFDHVDEVGQIRALR